MMSAKFSLQAPTFDGGDLESYNLWLSQFKRYIKVTKPNDNDTLDLFLLCAGNKAAKFYNAVTWPDLTQAQTDAGITEYSRAVSFVTSKFSEIFYPRESNFILQSRNLTSRCMTFSANYDKLRNSATLQTHFQTRPYATPFVKDCKRTQPNEPFAEDSQQLIRKDNHFHWTMQFRQRKWRKPPSNPVDLWR